VLGFSGSGMPSKGGEQKPNSHPPLSFWRRQTDIGHGGDSASWVELATVHVGGPESPPLWQIRFPSLLPAIPSLPFRIPINRRTNPPPIGAFHTSISLRQSPIFGFFELLPLWKCSFTPWKMEYYQLCLALLPNARLPSRVPAGPQEDSVTQLAALPSIKLSPRKFLLRLASPPRCTTFPSSRLPFGLLSPPHANRRFARSRWDCVQPDSGDLGPLFFYAKPWSQSTCFEKALSGDLMHFFRDFRRRWSSHTSRRSRGRVSGETLGVNRTDSPFWLKRNWFFHLYQLIRSQRTLTR